MSDESEDRRSAVQTARVDYELSFEADDVVRGLEKDDDRVFMFIMQILDHDDVGIEVRDRLIEELTAEADAKGIQ